MPSEIIFLFYSASGTAGIETNSQFPVESDSTDAETNDESGNSTELHHPPESEAPQKIEGKMCVYDYLYYFEIIIFFIQPQVLVLRPIASPL